MLLLSLALSGCLGNPQVEAGNFGYVTNEPFLFGDKGEFLGIQIGPSSYGLGWLNEIKHQISYKPWTIKENFSPKGGVAENSNNRHSNSDTRIMSSDKINMELSVSVVLSIRESPATGGDKEQFKLHARKFVEDFTNFWNDRYREPFRAKTRTRLGTETYGSAKTNREKISKELEAYLNTEFEGTPITCVSVQVSNINPPQRMLGEQEMKKATEIMRDRQALEKEVEDERKAVLEQKARNLRAALEIEPRLMDWRRLDIDEKYAEAFQNVVTGEEAKSIEKFVFIPFGSSVTANSDMGSSTPQPPTQKKK